MDVRLRVPAEGDATGYFEASSSEGQAGPADFAVPAIVDRAIQHRKESEKNFMRGDVQNGRRSGVRCPNERRRGDTISLSVTSAAHVG